MISDWAGLCLFGWPDDLTRYDKVEAAWCWGCRIRLTAVLFRDGRGLYRRPNTRITPVSRLGLVYELVLKQVRKLRAHAAAISPVPFSLLLLRLLLPLMIRFLALRHGQLLLLSQAADPNQPPMAH